MDWHSLAVASASPPETSAMAISPARRCLGPDVPECLDGVRIDMAIFRNCWVDPILAPARLLALTKIIRPAGTQSSEWARGAPRPSAFQCTPEFLQRARGTLQGSDPSSFSIPSNRPRNLTVRHPVRPRDNPGRHRI